MITISAAKSSFGRAAIRCRAASPRPGDIKVRSNDYLCLAGHPHVIDSEIAALRAGGHGDAVSRVWVHHERDVTRDFEQRVAALMQAEDCVVCSSGYTANVGLIQSFATRGSPVYLDMKAHISLHEGVVSAGREARAVPPQRPAVARPHAGAARPRPRCRRCPLQHRRRHRAARASSSRYASATAPR